MISRNIVIEIYQIPIYNKNQLNNNHKDPCYDQKQKIINEKKHTIERGNKSVYLIAFVLTSLSQIV
jgi:hypothetical protein